MLSAVAWAPTRHEIDIAIPTKGATQMAKPELGTKRVCVACGTRFYDLGKSPAVCPKCSTEQPVDQPRGRRNLGNVPETDKRPKKPVPGIEETDVEIEAPEGDEDEDVLETDLEDDDDGLGEDIDVNPVSTDEA